MLNHGDKFAPTHQRPGPSPLCGGGRQEVDPSNIARCAAMILTRCPQVLGCGDDPHRVFRDQI